MRGAYRARQIISAIRGEREAPRESPLPGVMTVEDFEAVSDLAPMTVGTTRVSGYPVTFSDKYGVLHSARELFFEQAYRFTAASDQPHIIDAGANIGLSVLYFKSLYPDATIVAFEPDAKIFSLLKMNTGGLSGITLHQAAAWVENSTLTFFTEGSLAGSLEVDYLGTGAKTDVAAVRLRDEVRKRPVDLLKIDIEGAENDVLFDLADSLDDVSNLFFEYHSSPDKPQRLGQMLDLVASKGFRYVINSAHGADHPFVDRIAQGFDLQLNAYCYRPDRELRPVKRGPAGLEPL